MANSVNRKSSAQVSEKPLRMSNFVNFEFDFDVDTPQTISGSKSPDSVSERLQSMRLDEPYVGFNDCVDKEDAGIVQVPSGSDALRNGLHTNQVAPEDLVAITNPEESDITDIIDLAALEIPHSPSRWVPLDAELQQNLNRVCVSQVPRLSLDPNPPPVLYLLPEQSSIFPMQSVPTHHDTRPDLPQTPRTTNGVPAVDPSVPIQSIKEMAQVQSLSNGTNYPVSPVTDAYAASETVSYGKRAQKTIRLNLEPAFKRSKGAQGIPLPAFANNENSGDESVIDPDSSAWSRDESTLDTQTITSSPSDSFNWRYEQQAQSSRRDQQVKLWRRRNEKVKAKATNRRVQKLLEEIADTKEFAEVQGYEVGESMRERPVRNGARKSYVGQE